MIHFIAKLNKNLDNQLQVIDMETDNIIENSQRLDKPEEHTDHPNPGQ